MHISCNGSKYCTDTARLVASYGGNEWSEAGCLLYQTPHGSFFKVIYGHEGEEVGFSVIDYAHANELIAKHKVTPVLWPS